MRLRDVTLPLVMLLLCGASAGRAADFIYTPKPAEADSTEGIRVREITVKKGDTLSRLSKQHSGRGYYYPQILLFNEIKNPHRIKPGQVVRVPVSRKVAAAKRSAKTAASANVRKELPQTQPAPVVAEVQQKPAEKPAPVSHAVTKGEKNAYQRAVIAFKKGDCDNAIKLFDEFISSHPSSTLLPEATLNRAECYLKLSAKQ